MGRGGMVGTSQPLAVAAGLEILAQGGSTADAAVATAAALNVAEPTSTGIGGAFNRNPRDLPAPQTIVRALCHFYDIGIGYRLGKGVSVDAIAIGRF